MAIFVQGDQFLHNGKIIAPDTWINVKNIVINVINVTGADKNGERFP